MSKLLSLKFSTKIIILFLVSIGGFLRFVNLNWGSPFYFHPDERNIASSVSQLHFLGQMNPRFFAYGGFPIYLIYFLSVFFNLISASYPILSVSLLRAIIVSRLFSALLSIFLIPLTYFAASKIGGKKSGVIALVLSLFSVGYIQFAHFGTFEMWLSFFGLVLFLSCINYIKKPNLLSLVFISVLTGILVGIKVSSLVFIPLLVSIFFLIDFKNIAGNKKIKFAGITEFIQRIILFLFVVFVVYLISNPYTFLDFNSFLSSMRYESAVALGTIPVFYTGDFFGTVPILYQFFRIYPFLLNPIITLIFVFSIFYLGYLCLKTKSRNFLLLILFFLVLFLPNAFLFVKWTRYIVPTLPFVYIISGVALGDILNKFRFFYYRATLILLTIIGLIFSVSFVLATYASSYTSMAAALWAKNNIPSNARILSEVYDLGILPFNRYFINISLFDFYSLDSNSYLRQNLKLRLKDDEYIILPSQRIMKSRFINRTRFPNGYKFYSALFSGKLGYKLIYQTPCDIFCKIAYLGDPVFRYETTSDVFDRPTVFIFKKSL
ncbi:hypothetical protein M1615_05135 [Patescibacteria group bacterium]|nr:hypothetical protein [Patescibacteria group bacterium]MCL5010042.1 hypothetical protein [Patescibacteria group bacterium]